MPNKEGYSNMDTDDPGVRKLVVSGLVQMHDEIAANHPQFRMLGAQWYPKVQEATEKGVREHFGRTLQHSLAGPGMVSAVSPNMDWERTNIDAFHELASMSDRTWRAVSASAANTRQAQAHNQNLKREAEAGGYEVNEADLAPAGRSNEAKALLKDLGIRRAPDLNLLKAQRIMQGEDPERVIRRNGAPKTFSFMHNIAGNPHYVTIDGRAYDMAANQMRPWTSGRGISSAALKSGKISRYESIESMYKEAAQHISARDARTGQRVELQPHHLQAILWEFGKHIERGGLTGGPMTEKGVQRIGQPYFSDLPMTVPARTKPAASGETTTPAKPAPAVGRSRAERRGGR